MPHDNINYRDIVLNLTKPVQYLEQFNSGEPFVLLATDIREEKKKLNYNSVDFIICQLLDKNDKLIDYRKRGSINVFVLGSFKNEFTPAEKVAKVFAEFYMEMMVLPNLISITKKEFLNNHKKMISKLRNGILIYDREGNLH